MSIIGLILARGGSKGIPGKNLKELCGKSLIFRCAENAIKSNLDKVYVYSDSEEILDEGRAAGALPIHRPEDVSGDVVTSEDTVIRFMKDMEMDHGADVMLIQCTTPFLKTSHIDAGIAAFEADDEFDSVISATACHRYLGYRNRPGNWIPVFPYRWLRQEQDPLYYMENGGFYLSKNACWREGQRIGRKCGVVLMDWWESLEIDEPDDLMIADHIAKLFV